jgi:uncharacterized protein YycO
MYLKPADIIMTTDKKSLFSAAILAVLNFFQRDEVKYQHTMLVVDNDICIEAVNKITYSYIVKRMADFKQYKIIRHKDITDEQREAVVNRARTMIGKHYGYARLALQLMDQVFRTNWFTKRIKDPDYQICSSLIAWCYDKETGIRFNGINWAAVEPDDIDDEALLNKDWETVLEWERV